MAAVFRAAATPRKWEKLKLTLLQICGGLPTRRYEIIA